MNITKSLVVVAAVSLLSISSISTTPAHAGTVKKYHKGLKCMKFDPNLNVTNYLVASATNKCKGTYRVKIDWRGFGPIRVKDSACHTLKPGYNFKSYRSSPVATAKGLKAC